MFITFEGIEGTGKTTQITKVQEYLENSGYNVFLTREPGGSRIGQELRKMLLHIENTDLTPTTELFLYLADRAQHIDQVIKPQLDAGNIVLCDRFADSTIVYQGYGRGLDTTILQQLNEVAINGLWPELTILLDIPPELGLQRATSRNTADGLTATEGRFEAENITFHKRIREGYLSWAAQNNERIKVADASASEDDVFLSIRALLESYLKH